MTQAPSIIVNCPRIHSNLLRIVAATDGLVLFFLNEASPGLELLQVSDTQILSYEEFPEARDIVHRAFDHDIWDADMLWSIASLNEDAAITPLGHYALHNDDLWSDKSLSVTDPLEESVA